MTTADIDRDVWEPFTAAYPALDADLLASTYSPELVHAGGPGSTATRLDEHVGEIRAFFDHVRAAGDAFAIEFRFDERILGDGVASERGVFRIDVRLADGSTRQSHGYFHVILRVEQGRWRILTDYDRPGATAEEFAAATPWG